MVLNKGQLDELAIRLAGMQQYLTEFCAAFLKQNRWFLRPSRLEQICHQQLIAVYALHLVHSSQLYGEDRDQEILKAISMLDPLHFEKFKVKDSKPYMGILEQYLHVMGIMFDAGLISPDKEVDESLVKIRGRPTTPGQPSEVRTAGADA